MVINNVGYITQAIEPIRAPTYEDLREKVSSQAAVIAQLRELAFTDMRSRLGNTHAMGKIFPWWYEQNAAHGKVLFVDFDNFKRINDISHQLGDKIITHFGESIQEVFATTLDYLNKPLSDSAVAYRYGGEEFLLALPYASPDFPGRTDVSGLVKNIAGIFGQKSQIAISKFRDGKASPVTLSIGAATTHPDVSIEEVIRRAQESMKIAKGTKESDLLSEQRRVIERKNQLVDLGELTRYTLFNRAA